MGVYACLAGAMVPLQGGLWIQEALDLQVPRAIRVLDVMHAFEYLAAAAKASFGPGTGATGEWIGHWRLALRAGRWKDVLRELGLMR